MTDGMRASGGAPFATFTFDHVNNVIHDLGKEILSTKFHELLVGWMLCHFLRTDVLEQTWIGFPLVDVGIDPHVSVSEFLRNHRGQIDDRDVDIAIGHQSEGSLTNAIGRFQLTRYWYPDHDSDHKTLIDLIRQKCEHYSEDDKLNLVVSVERRPNLTESELRQFLTSGKVPFGGIFLLLKEPDMAATFKVAQIHPQIRIGKTVEILPHKGLR